MDQEASSVEMTTQRRDAWAEMLKGGGRRARQEASAGLLAMARLDAGMLCDVVPDLLGALELPEAQTRWQCLDALTEVTRVNAEITVDAFAGAEEALFDEHAALVRLAAFRFLACYGSTAPERSLEAWPLIKEAVQCYHGDLEYRDMLVGLLEFSQGDIAEEVRSALGERMEFDARNGKGLIRRYSAEICAAVGKE